MRRFALLVAGLALLAGVAATVSGGGTQAESRWVITDLGTLGGKESEVGSGTTSIFLEVANFDPSRTRAMRRKLGLSTDASYRFERAQFSHLKRPNDRVQPRLCRPAVHQSLEQMSAAAKTSAGTPCWAGSDGDSEDNAGGTRAVHDPDSYPTISP